MAIRTATRRVLLGNVTAVAAAAFAGAYDDIPSITAAYGMRRLLTSYTSNLVRIRRSSDSSEQDFGYDANGDLDTAAISTFIGGGSGYIATWYDQSGNSLNVTQATTSAQPLYVASGQNSKPILRFDTTDFLSRASTTGSALVGTNTGSLLIVQKQDGVTANNTTTDWNESVSTNRFLIHATYGNTIYFDFGNVSGGGRISGAEPAGWDDAYHVVAFVRNTTAGDVYVDTASEVSGTFSDDLDNTGSATFTIGGANAAAKLDGEIAEFVLANAGWSTANRQAAESAANDYWSVY